MSNAPALTPAQIDKIRRDTARALGESIDERSHYRRFLDDVLPLVPQEIEGWKRSIDGHAGSIMWTRPTDDMAIYCTPWWSDEEGAPFAYDDSEGNLVAIGEMNFPKYMTTDTPDAIIAVRYIRVMRILIAGRQGIEQQ